MKMMKVVFALALVFAAIQSTIAQEDQAKERAEKRDQLKIAVQAICPITGNELGEHGDPVKVKIGEEHVFVCCKGCLKGEVSPEHWATIHNNFAKAQAKCPVMEKKLPKNPKWTVVEGQIVYICCPPCTDKIQAQPAKYLDAVNAAYESFLKEKR